MNSSAVARLTLCGDDEERVHPGNLAQILGRDDGDLPGDLLQRTHELFGRTGDQRRTAVGGIFPVTRERP